MAELLSIVSQSPTRRRHRMNVKFINYSAWKSVANGSLIS